MPKALETRFGSGEFCFEKQLPKLGLPDNCLDRVVERSRKHA